MGRRLVSVIASAALVFGTMPPQLRAQTQPVAASAAAGATDPAAETFSTEQLDALLAPIALYPDVLLTQVLMATTNPLEIVAASRWLAQGTNKDLKGPALETALKSQNWDPSVKSLVPFPQVLDMLNQNLEWTQQIGFAMHVQQPDVFDSVQRLRLQAQQAGNLQSTQQQIIRTEPPPPGAPHQIIVIEPAQPEIVFVPSYNPSQVFGTWPYAATPPVYIAPPVGYGYGNALAAGLMFGAGVAITAGLWGWARPNWGCCWGGGGGGGWNNVNVNVNRWNNINVNRPWNGGQNGQWRPNNPNYRPGGGWNRPGGPVGRPNNPGGRPPNAIGRPGVTVPGGVVRPPGGMGPGNNRPGIGNGNRPGAGDGNRPGGGDRPGLGQGNRPGGGGDRPGAGQGNRPCGGGADRPGVGQGNRPGGGGGAARPTRPDRQPPAMGGMNDGRRAQQFENRGSQSRQMNNGGGRGGGGRAGAGAGGGGRGGGGGGGGRGGGGGGGRNR